MGEHTDIEKSKSGFGTASLVLGIIGICTSFIPIVNNVSFLLGLIGAIFAIVSLIKKASKGQAIAGIILCILSIVITLNSQQALSEGLNEISNDLDKATGSNTEEVLDKEFDVEYGKYEVVKDSYSSTGKLVVIVKNKTNETKSASIQLEAVDGNGNRITNDYIYVNSLGAGQSQNFDVFGEYSESSITEMQNATFKIVEASSY